MKALPDNDEWSRLDPCPAGWFLDRQTDGPRKLWLKRLIERRGMNRAVVALANKNARQIWVLLARREEYRAAA